MKKFCALLFLISISVPLVLAQQNPKPMTLDKYKWKNRILLVFAPSAENEAFKEQQAQVAAHATGIAERDMVILEVLANAPAQGQAQLRSKYNISPDAFAVLLIGKDGTEKYRKAEAVPMKTIFGIIDQMPMRRQEMRKQ